MSSVLEIFSASPVMSTAAGVLIVVLVAYIADRLTKRVILSAVHRVARQTTFKWDDVLVESNFFGRAAHVAPALTVYLGVQLVPNLAPLVETSVQRLAAGAMILVAVSAIAAFLTALGKAYAKTPRAQEQPIEAYVQVTKIAVYVIGVVLVLATLTGRSPLLLLSGIGAITAVLLLVFRDTILSFVASIQMANYDMVRVGDWIEMPQFGADGDVIELSLHTVKVQNWDKTITAIPTHKLIEEPFKNWRGMQESGGRRIKRSFFVDMSSIRFLTDEELDRLESFAVLRDYIRGKRIELAESNRAYAHDPSLIVNARRLTNLGTLRAYLEGYLRQHPKIHQRMTLMVRQLAPTSEGLPMELYVFTNTTDWLAYEGIQSDIFDHILSIVHEFGVRVFQVPSGMDFAGFGGKVVDG
jgi:miniconductance mechanosensitive channel